METHAYYSSMGILIENIHSYKEKKLSNENRVAILAFEKVAIYIKETVKRAFHILITKHILDQLNTHLNNSNNAFVHFLNSDVGGHLDTALQHLQNCFPYLPQLAPEPSTSMSPQKFASVLNSTAQDYVKIVKGFSESVTELEQRIDILKNESDTLLQENRNRVDSQINDIDAAIGKQDLLYAELRDKIEEQSATQLVEIQNKFHSEFDDYSEELSKTDEKLKKILAVTSEKAQSGAYLTFAKRTNAERIVWLSITMLSFVALILTQLFFLPEFSELWLNITARIVIAFAFLSLSLFCITQASSRNKLYRIARLIGLELEILNGYLENFGESPDVQKTIRQDLVNKYFGVAMELEKRDADMNKKNFKMVKEVADIIGKIVPKQT